MSNKNNNPTGFSDIIGDHAKTMHDYTEKLYNVLENWGYNPTTSSQFENGKSLYNQGDDNSQNLLLTPTIGLRRDIITSLSRIFATKLMNVSLPLRLFEIGNVFTTDKTKSIHVKGFLNCSAIIFGGSTLDAMAELIAITVKILRSCFQLSDFKIILGNNEILTNVFNTYEIQEIERSSIQDSIKNKNAILLRQSLNNLTIEQSMFQTLVMLPKLCGNLDIIEKISADIQNPLLTKITTSFQQLYNYLESYGVAQYTSIDLGDINSQKFPQGINFEVFIRGVTEPIITGGSYQSLAEFGLDVPLVGVELRIDRILHACNFHKTTQALRQPDLLAENCHHKECLEKIMLLREQGKIIELDLSQKRTADLQDAAMQRGIPNILQCSKKVNDVY